MIMNNMRADFAEMRDEYFEERKELVEALEKNEDFVKRVERLQQKYKAAKLFELAQKSTDKINSGNLTDVEKIDEEIKVIAYLKGIVDFEETKEFTKEFYPDDEADRSK